MIKIGEDKKWKTFYKVVNKKETRKYSTNTYPNAPSNRTLKKLVGSGCQRKNGTENLCAVIMYLIEAFKMRLSTAESFESPKWSNSTFKWLGKFLKDELKLDLYLSKEPGPDYISVMVLKKCKPEFFYILAELFNKCLKESCFSRLLEGLISGPCIEEC